MSNSQIISKSSEIINKHNQISIGSLAKRTYINENRHENGINNYIWEKNIAEILIFSRIMFLWNDF